jgi:hypothetical protein
MTPKFSPDDSPAMRPILILLISDPGTAAGGADD